MDGEAVTRAAAAFLGEALGIAAAPEELRGDLIPVGENAVVSTYAIELASSAGPAAFLVYAYRLLAEDDAGMSGSARMAADVATMEEAARLDVPGPRLVARAEGDALGFVLATTPAYLRALAGGSERSAAGDVSPRDEADAVALRAQSAVDLLRALREASASARLWLGGGLTRGEALTPEETELALFLLEPGSLEPIMSAIRRLVEAGGPPRDDGR